MIVQCYSQLKKRSRRKVGVKGEGKGINDGRNLHDEQVGVCSELASS